MQIADRQRIPVKRHVLADVCLWCGCYRGNGGNGSDAPGEGGDVRCVELTKKRVSGHAMSRKPIFEQPREQQLTRQAGSKAALRLAVLWDCQVL